MCSFLIAGWEGQARRDPVSEGTTPGPNWVNKLPSANNKALERKTFLSCKIVWP